MERVVHLTKGEILRFFHGRLSAGESQRVVQHLLNGCQECREKTAGRWDQEVAGRQRSASSDRGFDRLFDRAAQAALARGSVIEDERKQAVALLFELDRHPIPRRKLLVANSARFQNWGLCEALLEAAFQSGFKEPERAIELSEVGLCVADQLPSDRYGERLVNDLKARAWGTLGNAQRIRSEHAEAEKAIQRALEIAEEGTGDPTERARILSFQAALRMAQRRYKDAVRIHNRILRIHSDLSDRHMVGRTQGEKARALRHLGEPVRAVALSREALGNLDRERDLRSVLVVRNGLAHSLIDTGRLEDATAELRDLRRESSALGNDLDALRCGWLLGRILMQRNRTREAEQTLRQTRDEFVEAGIPYDAALANLDLAQTLFEQGKFAEMKDRLAESIPIFRGLGIHQETIAALLFLKRAIELEEVTAGLIKATARFVEKSRKNPGLRFHAEALTDAV